MKRGDNRARAGNPFASYLCGFPTPMVAAAATRPRDYILAQRGYIYVRGIAALSPLNFPGPPVMATLTRGGAENFFLSLSSLFSPSFYRAVKVFLFKERGELLTGIESVMVYTYR